MTLTGHLVASEWEVLAIPEHAEALAFLRRTHYAKGGANCAVYRHGLYRRTDLWPLRSEVAGVAMWMPPTRVAAESVAGKDWGGGALSVPPGRRG